MTVMEILYFLIVLVVSWLYPFTKTHWTTHLKWIFKNCISVELLLKIRQTSTGCSTCALTLYVVSLNLRHSSGWAVEYHCNLICISMMINDVEYFLCVCLLVIYISFLVKWRFKPFVCYLMGLFVFSTLSCRHSLDTRDTSPCHIYTLQIFPPNLCFTC